MEITEKNRLCGIFKLQGIRNKSQIKVNHVQNMSLKENEYISDDLLKNYKISDLVVGEIYSCNITDVFLMSSKKLPIYYVSAIYERPLRRILLFRIYLYFNIETEINSAEQLLNEPLNGNFSLEICIDNKKKELDSKLEKYLGDEKIMNKLENFTMLDEMKELLDNLVEEANLKIREEYGNDFEYEEIPKKTISLEDYL